MTTLTGTRLDPTEVAVAEMLTANTGRHFLDSGGAYGRHWERNQGQTVETFRAEPRATLSKWSGITLSVFHYVTERLTYAPEHDAHCEAWSRTGEMADEPWLACAVAYAEMLHALDAPEWTPRGYRGDSESVQTYNTYNGEDWLSQTLQYVTLTLASDVTVDAVTDDYGAELAPSVTYPAGAYVWLQIHGGADVRGGYTRAYVFCDPSEDWGYSVADGSVFCAGVVRECVGQMATDGTVTDDRPEVHYWDWHAGTDCTDWTGTYVTDGPDLWEGWVADDDGTEYLPCPVCGAPLSADAPWAG